MYKPLSVFLLIVLMLGASPTLAIQDDGLTCDAATLKAAVDVFIGSLGNIRDETDTAVMSDTLQDLANTANKLRALCDELVFKGDTQTVIGPIQVPAGFYRTTLAVDADGYIGVQATVADGECGAGAYGSSGLLFNEGADDFGTEGEVIFQSEGCTLLIQVEINGDWELAFERLSTGS